MGEVDAFNIQRRPVRININNEKKLNVPSSETLEKSRVRVSVKRGEITRNAGYFIKKTFLSEESLERFLNHHKILREKGFPIPVTARRIKDTNDLIVTDLSSGGSFRVVSINEIAQGPLDNIRIDNFCEIEKVIKEIALRADNQGIIISPDAFFLVIDQQNRAKVYLGDLGAGIHIDEKEKKEATWNSSNEAAEHFLNLLKIIFVKSS